VDVEDGSFGGWLARLDRAVLVALLQARPDMLVEPVPRGFAQLAQRLNGPDSLVGALRAANRDMVVVSQAVAVLAGAATVPELSRLLGAPEPLVRGVAAELCGRGLVWVDAGGVLRLPERLGQHWLTEIGAEGRPAANIARSALADDLRAAVEGLGIGADGLRKPELVDRLSAALTDLPAVAERVAGLAAPARERLEVRRAGYEPVFFGSGGAYPRGTDSADRLLARVGLAVRVNNGYEVPREVTVAAWLAGRDLSLTGPPQIPRIETAVARQRAAFRAAAEELTRALTTLLDHASQAPIAALKRGGIGPRERSRLAAALSVPAELLVLCIDLAHDVGLLGNVEAGYAPTAGYPTWRAAPPGHQWATLATAWFGLPHAPTSREIADGKEQPPPLPLGSLAGALRRALLRAAAGGRSTSAAGAHIDWLFPVHGYGEVERDRKVAAAVREAELLGVAAAGALTEAGELLLAAAEAEPAQQVSELAARTTELLPEQPNTVILQSDLTAVSSGRPSAAAGRLLAAAAVNEARGAAGVWRFTPASVRAALDQGWTADRLLAELEELSARPLPQPLAYLIGDAARRHGEVRVRGTGCCVVADEARITEILHTRGLAKLELSALAPTVLSSPYQPDQVLARLRAAGLSPVAEDSTGTLIIERRPEHQAAPHPAPAHTARRPRLTAANLADQLAADPDGRAAPESFDGGTYQQLADLNPRLAQAELVLLAHALDHEQDVRIAYRDNFGTRTVRAIQPRQLYHRWLDSWCHLRNAQRDFTVANIESVTPA
jgi:hypothetical protein